MALAQDVLLADEGDLQARVLDAVARGDHRRATRLIFDNHARKARLIEAMGMRLTFERFVRHRLISDLVNRFELRPLLERLPPRRLMETLAAAAQWNLYIRHRFTSPSMLSIVALLGLLRDREGSVLDAPCGMGHLAFMMSKLFPPERIVCMDRSPPFVYSARRFFVPQLAAAIVHDMNYPLPLASEQFGLILCSDAFHYVQNREVLAREFTRILREDGVLVLAHVHNRLQRTSYAGFPLSPAEYSGLFKPHHVRMFPESYLLDAYLEDRPLDLARQFDEAELNPHRVLHVVVTKSPDALKRVPPARDALNQAARNPRPSGLFRMQRSGEQIVFHRAIPEGLRREYAEFRQILPERVAIDASKLTSRNGRLHFTNEQDLLRQHVLVDVPEDY
jgi:SAM-dependent methyltransferase